MWPLNYLVQCAKKLLTSNIGIFFLIVIFIYLMRSRLLWHFFRRVRNLARVSKLKLPFSQSTSSVVDDALAAWELRKEFVGVYSIQGRRLHMEDRFSVIEHEQIGASIYGVFDGHGGQVVDCYILLI